MLKYRECMRKKKLINALFNQLLYYNEKLNGFNEL